MQRRHFEAIAAVLLAQKPDASKGLHSAARFHQWADTVRAFADMASTQNAQFKRGKFLKACGYDAEG